MEISELDLWEFKTEIKDGDEILCPNCDKWNNHKNWLAAEIGCEDCGSHDAIECPACGETFDHVSSPTFEIRSRDYR